jgi:sugar O-acyltransferase (sialic acid O-acetyltransferase NeuD family)
MIVIFGSSGHSKEIYSILNENQLLVDYFVDVNNVENTIKGIPIISEETFFGLDHNKLSKIYIGIGDLTIRTNVVAKLFKNGYTFENFPNLFSKSSVFLSEVTNLGYGNYFFPNSIVSIECKIGNFNHFNTFSSISHNTNILNFCTFSPRVTICGTCNISSNVFFGAAATIIDNVQIEENVLIGAGAVVIKSILEPGTYLGIPAKKIK